MAENTEIEQGQGATKTFRWAKVLNPLNHFPVLEQIFGATDLTTDEHLAGGTLWAAWHKPGKVLADRASQKKNGKTLTGNLKSLVGMDAEVTNEAPVDAAWADKILAVPMIGGVVEPIASVASSLGDRDIKGAVNAAAAAKKATSTIQTTGVDVTQPTVTHGGPGVS